MITLISLLSLLAFSEPMFSSDPGQGLNHNCIHVVAMSDGLFQFTYDRDVAGADIEVFRYDNGKKVLSASVKAKRTQVSLRDQAPGDYIILITRGDFRRKYVYHKVN